MIYNILFHNYSSWVILYMICYTFEILVARYVSKNGYSSYEMLSLEKLWKIKIDTGKIWVWKLFDNNALLFMLSLLQDSVTNSKLDAVLCSAEWFVQ